MNRSKKIRAIIAVLVLIILIATGFTFSRYSDVITGKVNINLAKWKFTASTNGADDLSNIVLTTENGRGAAPGTSGSFDIILDSTGATVDISYRSKISDVNVPANMLFYLKDENATSPNYETISQIINGRIQGNFIVGDVQSKKYTICWEWPLEGNDTIPTEDTAYGFGIEVEAQQF